MRQNLLLAAGILTVVGVLYQPARGASPSRPFDDYSPPSSVSPYMNLMNNNGTSTDANMFMNYQLFVKPQLEQRRINKQSTTAIHELQQQQKQTANTKRPQSNAEGNQRLRATGHNVTRANYSHYYPGLNRQAPQ